jgi:subtilisin family serine protease
MAVPGAIEALRSDPDVIYAEPNWIYTHQLASTDTYFTERVALGDVRRETAPVNQYGSHAAVAWAAGHAGSKSVYVGVIDEGIQFNHPDLDANIWENPYDPVDGRDNDNNGYVDDEHGWDFDGNNNTIYDGGTRGSLDDHGTHVAGTIGAESNATGVVGVNWNVTMISGKFLGRRGGSLANAVKAVDYFTDLKKRHGLNIVATNNSWGGGGFSQALLDAINRGGNAGILFIAAAGNGGSDGVGDDNDVTASYPSNYQCTANGTYDCVIAVAAITKEGAKSSFSNFGAKTVDIGAPGSAVWSTTAFDTYSSYSGTSMATPHVTGGAALYAASNPGASAKQIRDAITTSAIPTASLAGKTVTGGRLNVSGF